MARPFTWGLAAAFVVSVAWAGIARADDADDLKDLATDCGGKVDTSDIRGCLERAREIAETSPSPYLQSLLARLERQAEAAAADNGGKHMVSSSKSAGNSADPAYVGTQRPDYTEAASSDWSDPKFNSDMDSSNLGRSADEPPKEIDMNDDQKAPTEQGPHS